jgi:hypothetical protein
MFIKIFSIQILLQQKVPFFNSTSDQSTTGSNYQIKKTVATATNPNFSISVMVLTKQHQKMNPFNSSGTKK